MLNRSGDSEHPYFTFSQGSYYLFTIEYFTGCGFVINGYYVGICTLGGGSKKIFPLFTSECVLFSSRSFIVSDLTFRSLVWVLFLCMMLGSVLISFFYMYLPNFPSTTYWRDCLFSIVQSFGYYFFQSQDMVYLSFLKAPSLGADPIPVPSFSFYPTQLCGDFLALSKVWGLLSAFSRCSV